MRIAFGCRMVVALTLPAAAAAQNCGWSHVDHLVSLDNSGVWNPSVWRDITAALTIAPVSAISPTDARSTTKGVCFRAE